MFRRLKSIYDFFPGSLFINARFFWAVTALCLVYLLAFFLPPLLTVAHSLLVLFLSITLIDAFLLFMPGNRIRLQRRMARLLSLGDNNRIYLDIANLSPLSLNIRILEELPTPFQMRDFELRLSLDSMQKENISYELRPTIRGEYHFGDTILICRNSLGLLSRRFRLPTAQTVAVYPSIIQMREFELKALNKISTHYGIKKIRRIGHSYEFEQIKNYVAGDDFRSVNWKATSRRSSVMVNQYEEEKAQQMYCLIDRGRSMKLPFHGLSLLDYAVNTSLVLSNIALKKGDRAGLLSFADKIGSSVKAERNAAQLRLILENLYNEGEKDLEANYELMYQAVRRLVKGRSLIVLFTNFESSYSMERVLPLLRAINRQHLLLVMFFENIEIADFIDKPTIRVEDIYNQTVARKYMYEKMQMVNQLRQYGIQAVLTRPELLSVNAVNKYLEFKSRGLI